MFDNPHVGIEFTHPLELRGLATGQLHRVRTPSALSTKDRERFVLAPIRRAVADGRPVLYVDWARRSQRWGDVLAAVVHNSLLATLRRRENDPVLGFAVDSLTEPLGVKVLHAASRHAASYGSCTIVLDATQPGPNSCPPEASDTRLIAFSPDTIASSRYPTVLLYPASSRHLRLL